MKNYAQSYAGLEWSGTYYLIYRDLPDILRHHVSGQRALDFGCGTGRSTRLLRSIGYTVTGVDISEFIIRSARKKDPSGEYLLLEDGNLNQLSAGSFDLTLAAFPFDNIPGSEKPRCLRELRSLLAPQGRIINIVSSPEIYVHEWASFSTREFSRENQRAKEETSFGSSRPSSGETNPRKTCSVRMNRMARFTPPAVSKYWRATNHWPVKMRTYRGSVRHE